MRTTTLGKSYTVYGPNGSITRCLKVFLWVCFGASWDYDEARRNIDTMQPGPYIDDRTDARISNDCCPRTISVVE